MRRAEATALDHDEEGAELAVARALHWIDAPAKVKPVPMPEIDRTGEVPQRPDPVDGIVPPSTDSKWLSPDAIAEERSGGSQEGQP